MPFAQIRGQPVVVAYLLNALRSDRLQHAMLFEGSEGVGKLTTAVAVAQAVNCVGERGADGDACGVCAACRRIASGAHPDVQVFAPEGQFVKIEQMRFLRHRAYIKATEGPWKVFIVDGAHRMNKESANCILKVLEEPPSGTMIVLVAEDEYSLPSTIPSRCAVIPFAPLDVETAVQVLAERSGRPREELDVIARISGGNLTEAVRYLDLPWIMEVRLQALELMFRALQIEPSVGLLVLADEVVQVSDRIADGLEKAGGGITRFQALGVVYRIWISALRDCLLLGRGLDGRVANMDCEPRLRRVAEETGSAAILVWLELLLARSADLAGNANRLLSLESLLFQMSRVRIAELAMGA